MFGALVLVLLAASLVRRLTARVVVAGPSMLPGLAEGDRLLVLRTPVVEEGDVVCLLDPDDDGRLLVKRVSRLEAETIEVRGDNAAASRDSRQFGSVPRARLVGRVVYRYHPPQSVGPLRRQRQPARGAARYDCQRCR